jgi:hypothetical protein
VCPLLFLIVNVPGNLGSLLVMLVLSPVFFIILLRFGILAAIIALCLDAIIKGIRAFLTLSSWYSGYGYAALLILGVIVLYAFHTSLGGRPLFCTPRLGD